MAEQMDPAPRNGRRGAQDTRALLAQSHWQKATPAHPSATMNTDKGFDPARLCSAAPYPLSSLSLSQVNVLVEYGWLCLLCMFLLPTWGR